MSRPRALVNGLFTTFTHTKDGSMTSSRSAATVSGVADRLLILGALTTIAVFLLQLLDFGYGRDQGIFAAVARTIREGGLPYRDAWDFKPPGIYFVYAIAGSGVHAIRVIEAAALASMVGAFALLSRRYVGDARAGIVGGAIAIITHVRLEFWHTAQPESFGAVLVAWGLAAAAYAIDRDVAASRSRALWFIAGLCYGAATLLKPTIGVAALASPVASLVWQRRSRDALMPRGALSVAAPLVVGAAIPITACLAFFATRGGLNDLRQAMAFAPHYTMVSWANVSGWTLGELLMRRWLVEYSLFIPIGLALLVVAGIPASVRSGLLHIGGAIALLLVGVVVQAKLFPYHFGAALPLTALVAGWGFWCMWRRCTAKPLAQAVWFALIVVLAFVQPGSSDLRDTFWDRCALRWQSWIHANERQAIRDRLYSVADYQAADNRLLAQWIEERTPVGAAVYIYGFTPEVYVTTGRRFASRYIYNVPQRAPWSRDAARAELLADLDARSPEAIVVERGDVMPWVVENWNDSSRDLASFDALRNLVHSHYRVAATIGKFDVYSRTR